jgi:hypothetical protein
MEVEIRHVAQHPSHIGDVPGWQQGQQIPIPPEVEHLTGQPHRVVRGSEMVKEKSLTAGRDLDLLGSEWLPFRHLMLAVLASGL